MNKVEIITNTQSIISTYKINRIPRANKASKPSRKWKYTADFHLKLKRTEAKIHLTTSQVEKNYARKITYIECKKEQSVLQTWQTFEKYIYSYLSHCLFSTHKFEIKTTACTVEKVFQAYSFFNFKPGQNRNTYLNNLLVTRLSQMRRSFTKQAFFMFYSSLKLKELQS